LQRYADLTGFFSKWRPSAILDLLGAYWDHPRRPLDGLHRYNILPVWLENTYSRPKNWGFRGISPPKWGAMSTKPQKGTSAVRIGSSCVLIMSLSVIDPEKSRGNKKCDKEEERHIFGLFGITVKWP